MSKLQHGRSRPTYDELETNIRALLPEIPYRKAFVNKDDVFKDEELEELGAVLGTHPRTMPWSDHPRLYALLRMSMSQEEDITVEPFVQSNSLSDGLSDYGIPYTYNTLPLVLKESAHLATRFLQLQIAVTSSPESLAFANRKWCYRHRVTSNPPFTSNAEIAYTAGACVESVCNTSSKRVFARKTMRRGTTEREAREDHRWRIAHFQHEAAVLKRLDHVHMVSYCGSYTSETHFALLFEPVAERTLEDLLISSTPMSDTDTTILKLSFGCLACGLAWLHSKSIRHKDIKPANILINKGSVLYCDFGSALDAEFRDTTQTEGAMHQRTLRYVSPETKNGEPRDEACDIWSLGCVYLEMLTKLCSLSVDDLLRSIHQTIDMPGQAHEVCYWMAVESDILKDWIEALPSVHELSEPAYWTSTMVEGKPSSRTSAAKLVGNIQSHKLTNPNRAYISECCASGIVPPMKMKKHTRSRSNHEVCPSFWSASTSDSPSPAVSRSPSGKSLETPQSLVGIQAIPTTSSIQPLAKTLTEHPEIPLAIGEPHPGVLVSTAKLSQSSLQILQGREASPEIFNFYSLRLYELRNPDVLLSTRRLVFSQAASSCVSEARSFWLPLADISVQRVEEHVLLSWPDCDHHVQPLVHGMRLHFRVYKRKCPNNTLFIHCATTEDAQNFVRTLHAPCAERLILLNDPLPLSPSPADSLWTLTLHGQAEQSSAHPKAPRTIQFFDYPKVEQPAKGRGLLVTGAHDSASSTSRIYWLPPAVDITLDVDDASGSGRPKPCLNLEGLLVSHYKSGVRGASPNRKNDVGIFEAVEPRACPVTWRFSSLDDRHMFLDGISDWSLRLCMSIKNVSHRRMMRQKSFGRADLMFFVHEQKAHGAFALRLRECKDSRRRWITGRIPTSGSLEKYDDMGTSIRLTCYLQSEFLHLETMQAVTVSEAESKIPSATGSEGRQQTLRMHFHIESDRNDFQHYLTQYHHHHGRDEGTKQLTFGDVPTSIISRDAYTVGAAS